MRAFFHLSVVFSACLAACSHDESTGAANATVGSNPPVASPGATSAGAAQTDSKSAIAPRVRVRMHDDDLDELRRALDHGDLTRVRALAEVAARAGDESVLLRARASALEPHGTLEALRLIEVARTAMPNNPDVYATAAEIYAANDGADTAWTEIVRGDHACGEGTPELARARGVVWICRENGATKGLEFLEKARALDPALPFCDRPLAQAHLLVAKLAARDSNLDRAYEHVKRSLTFDARDVDARRFLSEMQAAHGEFAGAIATLEALGAEGLDLRAEIATLHKHAGLAHLLASRRAEALREFALARAGGLTDADLGTGARLLSEESSARTDAGVAAFEKHDLDAAEREFRAALNLEPDALAARNHLAVVLFKKKDYTGAAEAWRAVMKSAHDEGIELPEPVHLNLAKALAQAKDIEGARAVLNDYLAHEPEGGWRDPTQAMLDELKTVDPPK